MIVKNTTQSPIFVKIPVDRLLLSGNNEIPTKEYAELRPHITDFLDQKILVEVHGSTAVKVDEKSGDTIVDTSKLKEFGSLDAEAKKELIKDTVNLQTLEAWLQVEKDSSVRLIIERRVSEIKDYKGPE